MRTFCALAVAVAASLPSAQATAAPGAATKFTYFPIKGATAREIYSDILRRGPRLEGQKALASTDRTVSPQGILRQTDACRFADHRLKMTFVIHLPKLAGGQSLQGDTLRRWTAFLAHLRRHEETHRAIWLACGKAFEEQVRTLKAPTCALLEASYLSLWKQTEAKCNKRHAAFDATEQKRLPTLPFVRLIIAKPAGAARAATAPRPRKAQAARGG